MKVVMLGEKNLGLLMKGSWRMDIGVGAGGRPQLTLDDNSLTFLFMAPN